MTKHRSVVAGWDPAHVNPDLSTGRPKGVQTAVDMRIATTYDVLAEGIFAKYGVPAITGSPTNSATISAFQAAITAPNGGFYLVTVDAAEAFTINLSNVGAFKIYVQQQDYQVDPTKVNSEVVIGVVYGATAIPAGSLLLFTGTITNQTSTNGLTFTPAFKYTGSASGSVRVPTQADLANVAVIQAGARALVTTNGGGGTAGEYFYNGSAWQISSVGNASLDSLLATGWIPNADTWTFSSYNSTLHTGVINVPSDATTRFSVGMWVRFAQTTGGTKWGLVSAVSTTSITVQMSGSSTLTNEALTSKFVSSMAHPAGAPDDTAFVYSYANGGSAGGTMYFENRGGIKQLYGSTGSVGTGQAMVNFPTGLFAAMRRVGADATGGYSNTNVVVGHIESYGTTSMGVFNIVVQGSSPSNPINVKALGV